MFKHALQRVAFQRPTVSRALAHWNQYLPHLFLCLLELPLSWTLSVWILCLSCSSVEMGPKDPIFGLTEVRTLTHLPPCWNAPPRNCA